jgi:AGZA family xanthine/uracil permease-like MFS transporter
MNATRPKLFRPGDINAFFGLMLDNMTQLVLMAAILVGIFGMPSDLVLQRMIPGTAMAVLLGDLLFTLMAWRKAKQDGHPNRTAMPLGIDTPSLFAFTFGIVGPAFLATGDAQKAWHISMAVVVTCGVAKLLGSFAGPYIHRHVPRAGLLGPIAGIALLLIAFLPALHIFELPLVGLVSLGVVLLTLVGKVRLPGGFPGALAAVVAGTALYYALKMAGMVPETGHGTEHILMFAPPLPSLGFLAGFADMGPYLPIALPFALAVLVGAVDVTESAAAVGDDYSSRSVIAVDGIATITSGLFGGVVQTTPYIGHPAYKAMGAGMGYTLLTALFIGLGGMFGYLALFVDLLPLAAVAPILVFIGLEITSQAFKATPKRHYDAVVLAFIPIVADLVLIQFKQVMGDLGKSAADLSAHMATTYQTILVMANGFILSALIWATMLAFVIDQRFKAAAAFAGLGVALSLVGLIHSPFEDGRLFWPGTTESSLPFSFAAAYGLLCLGLLALKEAPRQNDPEAI